MKIIINDNEYEMPLSNTFNEINDITASTINLNEKNDYDEMYKMYDFISNYVTSIEPTEFDDPKLSEKLFEIKKKLASVGGVVKYMHEKGKDESSIKIMIDLMELMLNYIDDCKKDERNRFGGK